jgi:hypothetical protein
VPVLVANGEGDPMILPHYSYLLAGLIPQAQVKIYPDSSVRQLPGFFGPTGAVLTGVR